MFKTSQLTRLSKNLTLITITVANNEVDNSNSGSNRLNKKLFKSSQRFI